MTWLFDTVDAILEREHYLGTKGARARLTYTDDHGVIVFSGVSSRRLPTQWLELSRWCLVPSGVGSRQWRACVLWLGKNTEATTIVSYSDPSVGHTGALYRASGWVWAPTWHVLREPPTGNGTRSGRRQAPKHRWVYLLRPDDSRQEALALRDETLARMYPWASYTEPRWKRGVPQLGPLRGRYKRWIKK